MTRARPAAALLVILVATACGGTSPGRTSSTTPELVAVRAPPGTQLPARPVPVRVEMDSAAELARAGFSYWGSGSSDFAGGVLRTQTTSYEEWMMKQEEAPRTAWWEGVDPDRGWAVEVRLRLLSPPPQVCYGSGPGLWIHDGRRLVKLGVSAGQAGISYPSAALAPVARTDEWHTYRVEARDEWVRVLVDGAVLVERDEPAMVGGGGTATLMFGDLGGCGGSIVEWDYFGYDVAPRLSPPCLDCLEGEHVALARLRRALRDAAPEVAQAVTTGTDDVPTPCLAFAVYDGLVRRLVPRALDDVRRTQEADALRQLPPLAEGAVGPAREGLGALSLPPRANLQGVSRKRAIRPPYEERPRPPPQATWPGELRLGLELLAQGEHEGALRHARTALAEMLREGYPIGAELAELLSYAPRACR